MKVKALFENNETPTLPEYIKRCGVEIPYKEYVFPIGHVEKPENYDNLYHGLTILNDMVTYQYNIEDKIVIICDSDCDGYCSATIAYDFLRKMGVKEHNIEVLFHTGKQHGFSQDIIDQLQNKGDALHNVKWIWVPDAGTNDVFASTYYKNFFDITVLITDHHIATEDNFSAVVINNQTSNKVTNKQLCGAGVTHKLITAYCNEHGLKHHQTMLDLVALATIGDVCDLRVPENRMIVKWGTEHIHNKFLHAMCDEFVSDGDITPHSLAWNIIPKINAVCRDVETPEIHKALFNAFVDEFFNDMDFLNKLRECHSRQRNKANKLYEDAMKSGYVGDAVKIFIIENTPYTGLVASKLADAYNCPCMVVHESNNNHAYMGSLRSPVPLKSKLAESGLMTICAGHEASCGVGWMAQDIYKLSDYCNELNLEPEPKQVMYSTDNALIQPEIFEIADAGKEFWGHGVPEPTIYISNVGVNGKFIKELGSTKTTIKFTYGDIDFIMFFVNKETKEKMHVGEDVNMTWNIIGVPSINEFRGNERKQVVISEWEVE